MRIRTKVSFLTASLLLSFSYSGLLSAHPDDDAPLIASAFERAEEVESVDDAETEAPSKKSDLPLAGETEKLTFSTTEGTWLSLDVSPDGRQIIFDLLGDIYTMPISGGKATPLTQGLEYDSQPRFSPDGKWITYISDKSGNDNIWIAKADGSDARQMTFEKQNYYVSPTFTPDSQYIVATKSGNPPQSKMFHIDGGSGVTLSQAGSGDGVPGLGGVFSPDGRYMYYTKRGPSNQFPSAQIERYDIQTGMVDSITRGEGGGLRPVISPDGTILVYATRYETKTGLRVRNLVSGEDKRLVWPAQRDSQERGGIPSRDILPTYAFTPDGQFLVMNVDGKINKVSMQGGRVENIPFEVDVNLDVGPDLTAPYKVEQGDVTATIIHSPALSKDGSKLAMSALTKIYTMDHEVGAKPARLTKGDAWEFNPVYSPDGRWIAYVTWSTEGGHIWRMRANGKGKPERLTSHPAFYSDLTFSPDGERIIAIRGNRFQREQLFSEFFGFDINLDLVWLPAKGGDVHLITPARGARTPHFTNDASRIYLYDTSALISVNFDGSDKREHLKVEGPKGNRNSKQPSYAEDVRISPDGRYAIALVEKQVWLMPVIYQGDKALSVNVLSAKVPVVKLTNIGADFMGWADDGKTITWSIGSTFYERSLESIQFREEDDDKQDDSSDSTDIAEQTDESALPMVLEDDEAVTAFDIAVTVARNTPKGSIVLSGVNVLPMSAKSTQGMADILENQDILVTDNRIVAIGNVGQLDLPEGTKVVDLKGKFVTPGFVDTHAHFEFRNQDVLEPQNWSLTANLAYGVTAGLDVQTTTKDYFTYRDMVETGQSVGIRAFMTGPGIFGPNDFQSYEQTLAYLRRYSDHYNTHNIKSYVVGNRQQRQWVVQAAKELGLLPTTEGAGDMRLDITHAIDGMHGNEHSLPDGPIFNDVVELFAKTQTAYTPTLLVQYNGVPGREYFFTRTEVHDNQKLQRFYPHNRLDEMTRRRNGWVRDDEFSFSETARGAASIQRAGGLVGIGGHGEVQGLGYHWEMWAFGLNDAMTPVEILRAATIDGAKIIGIEQDLGSIEVGKLADMVVLDKNPLEDIRNTSSIDKVMKNGELFDGDTLTQEWPVQKPLKPFWWWKEIGITD